MKLQFMPLLLLSSSAALGALAQSGCTSKMEDERISSKVSIASSELDGGTFSGFFNSSSGLPQLLSATSGSASGSSVLIPPGALNVDLTVTVAATTSLANAAQAGDLGIAAVLASAGPAVFFQPSATVELGVPMQLSLPILLSAALLDDDANYGVVYKSLGLKDGVETTYSGFIPRSEMVIQNGLAKVSVSRFGAYQVVKTSEPVTTRIEQPSTFAIGTVPGADLIGTWTGPCESRSRSGTNSTTVTWYVQETLTFSGSTVSVSRKGSQLENCDPSMATYFEVTFEAPFVIGGVVTTGTNVPQDAVGSPRAFDATPGQMYGQVFPYSTSSNDPSDICGGSRPFLGVFPNSPTEIPNDECMAKIFDSDNSVTWDNTQKTDEKFLSLYVITKVPSGTATKLYFAEGDNQQQSGVRATAFSEKFYTKSTTH